MLLVSIASVEDVGPLDLPVMEFSGFFFFPHLGRLSEESRRLCLTRGVVVQTLVATAHKTDGGRLLGVFWRDGWTFNVAISQFMWRNEEWEWPTSRISCRP